jgi:hypothetical protein
MSIKAALAGNPNCGKTTLFNSLTKANEHTGNWHGVTVDSKGKIFEFNKEQFKLVDLPGIYSLTPLSFEEKVISFFHKEINDKDGYTKIKDSKFNFSTRIMDKTLTMRFEKEIEVNLLHLVSIIYEVNYYCKWYPFCKVSTTVNQPGKAKKCVYMIVEIPIIKDRDFFVYGFGINRLREDGTVLILCRGIDEESGIFQKEFKKVKNDKYVRGQILMFGFEIKVIGKGKVVVRGLCNIDPKISFIPKSIINLVSEKFAQEMFEKFIKVARQYEGSEYQNKNPSKIDMEFYNFIKEEVNELYPEYFN